MRERERGQPRSTLPKTNIHLSVYLSRPPSCLSSLPTHKLRLLSHLEADAADPALHARSAVPLSHLGRGLPCEASSATQSTAAASASSSASAALARRGSPVGAAGFSVGEILSVSRGLKQKERREQRLDSISHHQSKWHESWLARAQSGPSSLEAAVASDYYDRYAGHVCTFYPGEARERAGGRGLVSPARRPSVQEGDA